MKFFVVLLCAVGSLSAQTIVPIAQREGERHRREAEQFFEQLHVVPPGMNWRVVNAAVRDARAAGTTDNTQHIPTVGELGTWREIGSANQAGRVSAVEYDDATGRVWLAGDGGTIWSGDTSGALWKCHTDLRSINGARSLTYVRSANGSERLVVMTSTARAFTLNLSQNTWTEATGLDEIQRWGDFSNMAVCRRGGRMEMYAVGQEWDYSSAFKARGVLYRSLDSGASFERLRWFDGTRQIWTDRTSTVWLVHGDTLSAINADGSLDQILQPLPMFTPTTQNILLAGTSTNTVIMAVVQTERTMFHATGDNGISWLATGSVNFRPFGSRSFAQSHENEKWMFGGVEVVTSNSDGQEWNVVNTWGEYYQNIARKLHADIPTIVSFPRPSGGITFIATDGGLYTSRNGGESVRNISLQSLNVSQYYSSYTSRDNAGVVSAGAQDQGFQRSRVDSGGVRKFQQMISGDYSNLVSGDRGHSLFCVYPGYTLFIPNHEDGWEPRGLNFPHKNHLWLPPLTAGESRPEQVWLGGGTGTGNGVYIYTYTFKSGSLTIDSLPFDFGENKSDVRITALSFAPNNDDYCYLVTSTGVLWASYDHGESWKRRLRPDKLTGHYFSGNAICVDPKNPLRLLIGGSGYDGPAVYLSTNGGDSFRALNGLPPCLVLSIAMSDDGRYIAAATDAGAFLYDTTLSGWTDITALGAPDQTYWHVDRVEPLGIFRFSTYGRGIWDFKLQGPVSVHDVQLSARQTLTMRGMILADRSVIDVVSQTECECVVAWYDLQGRKIHVEKIVLSIGSNRLTKPTYNTTSNEPLTCIITTADGNVAAAVAP
ncbi:MAG: hypothetical protein H7X70_01425 [Candidatus Kapabacteria bacterium]|nr:hypothetical protein [Candidatus Kapabacteria bacterium]